MSDFDSRTDSRDDEALRQEDVDNQYEDEDALGQEDDSMNRSDPDDVLFGPVDPTGIVPDGVDAPTAFREDGA